MAEKKRRLGLWAKAARPRMDVGVGLLEGIPERRVSAPISVALTVFKVVNWLGRAEMTGGELCTCFCAHLLSVAGDPSVEVNLPAATSWASQRFMRNA